jgi:hypothetical protein
MMLHPVVVRERLRPPAALAPHLVSCPVWASVERPALAPPRRVSCPVSALQVQPVPASLRRVWCLASVLLAQPVPASLRRVWCPVSVLPAQPVPVSLRPVSVLQAWRALLVWGPLSSEDVRDRESVWGAPVPLPAVVSGSVEQERLLVASVALDGRALLRAGSVAQALQQAVSDALERQPAALLPVLVERAQWAQRVPMVQDEEWPPEAARADEARQGPGVRVRRVWALASAFHPVPILPSAAPVRRRAPMFARAMPRWRTASPSAQSWQAARDVALSCLEIPGGGLGRKKSKNRIVRQADEHRALGRIVASYKSEAHFIST